MLGATPSEDMDLEDWTIGEAATCCRTRGSLGREGLAPVKRSLETKDYFIRELFLLCSRRNWDVNKIVRIVQKMLTMTIVR